MARGALAMAGTSRAGLGPPPLPRPYYDTTGETVTELRRCYTPDATAFAVAAPTAWEEMIKAAKDGGSFHNY